MVPLDTKDGIPCFQGIFNKIQAFSTSDIQAIVKKAVVESMKAKCKRGGLMRR